MSETRLFRRPYRRRNADEWAEVLALYRAGATAKALAATYGGTERTIYTKAAKEGCLRKDDRPSQPEMTREAAEAAARAISGTPEDAPCRDLAADAEMAAAARASARAAVGMLRGGEAARSYAYARLSLVMLRLDRALEDHGAGGRGESGRTPQDEAALQAILERLGVEA